MGTHRLRIVLASVLLVSMSAGAALAHARPEGQLTIAFDVSIAPLFFDPADTPGIATPFVFAYAMHDAVTKRLPGNNLARSTAASGWPPPSPSTSRRSTRPSAWAARG
jgi:peptide/nickel transport system substrate-binding protein